MNINRLLIIIFLIVTVFSVIIIRLANIQLLHSEEYKYYAQKQQTATEKINADRGFIFDRDSVLLAYNKNDVNFFVDLTMTKENDIEKISKVFSNEFGLPKEHYLNLLKSNKKRVYIEKKVSPAKALKLKSIKINGLNYEDSPTRIYQFKNFASHLLGYTNLNNSGVEGIEKYYENNLKGVDGSRVILKDAIGNMITVVDEAAQPSQSGDNVFLTIKKNYQIILEEELRNGLKNCGGDYAVGILMNPNNGEILALANMEDFDPNQYYMFSDTIRRNKILTDTYEPGSTFKAITLSALIDKNLCDENEMINTENGNYKFKNILIKDTHPSKYLNVKNVFTQSSNIGMSKLSQKIEKETFYLYLRNFGFGNSTNINLPSESKGHLKNPSAWSDYTKSSISFGYEISITAMQLISAYAAIINGGLLFQPQLVNKIVDFQNRIKMQNQPILVRRVLNEQTSSKMKELMRAVVEEGTGKKAKLNYVSAGGKTGTSRKLYNGKYSTSFYNASFVGFFPVESPQYICLIVVNSPTLNSYYGGDVSAPIFKNVAERIIKFDENLNYLQTYLQQKQEKENVKTVFTSNNDSKELEYHAQENRNNLVPAEFDFNNLNIKQMPNLKGISIRDGIKILTKLNVKFEVSGSGIISSQSIEPGTKIYKGMKCSIKCEDNSFLGAVLY